MNHPPFLRDATAREIQAVLNILRVADHHREPEVRKALSATFEVIVGLIEERDRRGTMGEQRELSHDGG